MKVQPHESFFQTPRLFSATLLAAAMVCVPAAAAHGQAAPAPAPASSPAAAPASPPASVPAAGDSAKATALPPLTEDLLRKRFMGKVVFLRGLYMGDDLNFEIDGKVKGTPNTTSFTLSALEIRKVNLSKKKVELEADRYALHFDGALPYESDSKSFDKVKISKKPVRITIEREVVVTPKKKKETAKNKKEAAAATQMAKGIAPGSSTPAASSASAPAPAPAPALAPGTTTSPAHSAMLMDAALGKVFAFDIDEQMMVNLPEYWQRYFDSKRDHHEFEPSTPGVLEVGGDVTAPRVLNGIAPSSNQYAQKYGIAGLTLFRTVVDATGKPQQVAIARPIGFGLDEEAVQAIKTSRFQPATKDGKPVAVVTDIVVTFRIYSNRTKPGSVKKGQKQTQVVASAWDSGTPEAPSKAIQ